MIRTAQSYHLKDLVRLGRQYYEESPYRDTHTFDEDVLLNFLRRCVIQPHAEVAVALVQDRVVGGCIAYLGEYAWCTGFRTHIEFLYVEPESRALGLAEQLIEHIETWSQRNHSQEILAGDVGLRPRLTERFLEQQGFTDTGIVLRKTLHNEMA